MDDDGSKTRIEIKVRLKHACQKHMNLKQLDEVLHCDKFFRSLSIGFLISQNEWNATTKGRFFKEELSDQNQHK